MVEGPVNPFSGRRSLRPCLLQPSTIHFGTTALSSPCGRDTAIPLDGGRSFIAASYPSNWPFGGGLYSVLCMPGWIFRRRATALATALFGPWPDLSMRPADVVCHRHWRLATAHCGAPTFIVYTICRGGPFSPSSTRR
jgi:hypothetical protein